MSAQADKLPDNKSKSVVQEKPSKTGLEQSVIGFEDRRSEAIAQRKVQEMADNSQRPQSMQLKSLSEKNLSSIQHPIQKKVNKTGLPDNLKSGIENLSGYSMDDVRVHYNSDKPAQLQAHAYAQGTDIHIASGQEKYLPHEAWHVVQQKQGRVKPTMQMKGNLNINDDAGLEKEADVMGEKAINNPSEEIFKSNEVIMQISDVAQLAPMPSFGFPDTHNLYNAQESSKNSIYDGKKPSFGRKLYALRLSEFAGADGNQDLINIATNSGRQSVSSEFVQLDHNPSWSDRLINMQDYPNGKSDDEMNVWVENGFYKKWNNKYYPTNYAARMYYNDYDTLFPTSGGLNASRGADAVEEVGHMGSFSEELYKEFILNQYGAVAAGFIQGINMEDGGNPEMIIANIDATIERLQNVRLLFERLIHK